MKYWQNEFAIAVCLSAQEILVRFDKVTPRLAKQEHYNLCF